MEGFTVIIIVVAAFILLQFMWRRMRPGASSQAQIVNSLLTDVRINQRLIELLVNGEQIKRFCITGWLLNRERMDFLGKNVRTAVNEASEIAEEYNEKMKPVKEFQATGYVADIDLVKMLDCLRRSKTGLEDWLMATTGTLDPAGKSGFFDSLLGR
ncbi:MAG: hypothetical protein JW712_09460 [Dehalococcoidales bacterium]|nr:hypothetical protein [Dehalococcoidales bacterium]